MNGIGRARDVARLHARIIVVPSATFARPNHSKIHNSSRYIYDSTHALSGHTNTSRIAAADRKDV
jgi:hypothetical protein